jgi:hypothetical protein
MIGSGATPRGGKEVYLDEGPFTLIRSQNVLDFVCSTDRPAFINEEQANQLSNVELREMDVLLNITGDSVAQSIHICRFHSKPSSIPPATLNYAVEFADIASEYIIGLSFAVVPQYQSLSISFHYTSKSHRP